MFFLVRLVFTASLVILPHVSFAQADVFFVECETFSNSENLGGDAIVATGCEGAIGGVAVVGVDIAGEWIELDVLVPKNGNYRVSIRTTSPLLQSTKIKGTIVESGASTTFDFLGLGAG
jgi:hypothetical protein